MSKPESKSKQYVRKMIERFGWVTVNEGCREDVAAGKLAAELGLRCVQPTGTSMLKWISSRLRDEEASHEYRKAHGIQ